MRAGPEPPFDWSQTMGQYTRPLRTAIHHLKYHGKTALAAPLGQMLAHSLDSSASPLFAPRADPSLPIFDAVVPIPLHPSRLRQRGFNQAERLARVLAAERGWSLDTTGLRRVRRTEVQALLTSREERAANVQNAFAARSPTHFWNRSVLLVDDVLTTDGHRPRSRRHRPRRRRHPHCIVALHEVNGRRGFHHPLR